VSYTTYHPVFLDLNGRNVLIVGGGAIAVEKLHSLLPSGADITVISPEAVPEIQAWADERRLTWIPREFSDADVLDTFMVIAATDVPELNARVCGLADQDRRLANSVDDPVNCNFIMAAIARSGPMQIAVSSAGRSPAMAQRLRDRIKTEMLGDRVGELAELLGSWRPAAKEALPTYRDRQAFWESVLDSDVPEILAESGQEAASLAIGALLRKRSKGGCTEASAPGRVVLVGAGPGDPDLITLKGVKALQQADVVLYDRLVNPELLNHAPKHSLLVDVGKAPGDKGQPRQETIHALMVEHARRGRTVVRLKGGDPFVFGRGGEEQAALQEAGINCEVVPGISSAIAAPAAAGIPVTHRGLSTGFAVFTAQGAGIADTVQWESAAQIPTLVFLMGVERLSAIVENLLANGRSVDTPAAVISRATTPAQRSVTATLGTIVSAAGDLPSPATIVVGEVVRLGTVGNLVAQELIAS
jgi:uroporphyrin-III C-methyltransferase/precorrin-2 dehydrogenase/sirohydrochlorin ferrochelatase